MNRNLKFQSVSGFIAVMLLFFCRDVKAQFAPAAGQPGTSAIANDSTTIVNWADQVVSIDRGPTDIANGWTTLASYGNATDALGYAEGNGTAVVSLGDSGSVTLSFAFPVMNGPGHDFAIFENGFDDQFLELAFVEVSSDGSHFVRFPSTSLTQTLTQTSSFGPTNPEEINNLAGKYRQGYGTPFDLEDIIDSSGIDLDSVYFVRIIDVTGSLDPAYAAYDDQGNFINDPYPTDFASGGFDLDGVAVINENNIYASQEEGKEILISVFPNPSNGIFEIRSGGRVFDIRIYDLSGRIVFAKENCVDGNFDVSGEAGMYWMELIFEEGRMTQGIIIR